MRVIETEGNGTVLLRTENVTGHFDIPEGVKIIKENAFWCSSVQSITIPESVDEIGPMAFGSCDKLTDVVFLGNIFSIGNAVFKRCSSLQRITLPKNLAEISEELFAQCTSLREISLPDTISVIGRSAFHRCTALQEVTIPSSIRTISGDAFLACSSLKRIFLDVSDVSHLSISDTAFRFNEGLTLVVSPEKIEECRLHPVLGRFAQITSK